MLRHINLSGPDLHDDNDPRITVLTDDERPAVFYGHTKSDPPPTARPGRNNPDAGPSAAAFQL